MTTIAVKPVKISLLDGNRVKLQSIDAQGQEHAWVCNTNHFIEFVPLAMNFSNEINRLNNDSQKQTIITNQIKSISGGKIEGSSDLSLSITLDNSLQMHFVLTPALAHQLVEMLAVQLGIAKIERPSNLN